MHSVATGAARNAPHEEADNLAVARRRQSRTAIVDVLLSAGFLSGCLVVIFRSPLLPPRFSFDGDRIQGIAQGVVDSLGDTSFGYVADIYRALGLADAPLLAGFLGYSLFAALMVVPWRRGRVSARPILVGSLLCAALLLGAVYLGYFAKDIVVLPVVAIALFAPRRWWGETLVVASIVAYGATFRSYWLLVAVLYVAFRLTRFPRERMLGNICIVVMALVCSSMCIVLFFHHDPDYFRQVVNSGRDGATDASTLIHSFITGAEPLSGIINTVVTFVALQFPVPLLLAGSAYYLTLFALVSSLWGTAYVQVTAARKSLQSRKDSKYLRAIALVLAFLCTQALFEPDYGSALRHATPLLPLLMVMITRGLSYAPVTTRSGRILSSPDGKTRPQRSSK